MIQLMIRPLDAIIGNPIVERRLTYHGIHIGSSHTGNLAPLYHNGWWLVSSCVCIAGSGSRNAWTRFWREFLDTETWFVTTGNRPRLTTARKLGSWLDKNYERGISKVGRLWQKIIREGFQRWSVLLRGCCYSNLKCLIWGYPFRNVGVDGIGFHSSFQICVTQTVI